MRRYRDFTWDFPGAIPGGIANNHKQSNIHSSVADC